MGVAEGPENGDKPWEGWRHRRGKTHRWAQPSYQLYQTILEGNQKGTP